MLTAFLIFMSPLFPYLPISGVPVTAANDTNVQLVDASGECLSDMGTVDSFLAKNRNTSYMIDHVTEKDNLDQFKVDILLLAQLGIMTTQTFDEMFFFEQESKDEEGKVTKFNTVSYHYKGCTLSYAKTGEEFFPRIFGGGSSSD
jgi:hypothetical protein